MNAQTNSLKRKTALASVLFFLLFSLTLNSCREEPPKGQRDCTTYGTLVRPMCGVSVLDNFWIQLDNGKLYQPCQMDMVYFTKPNYYEGQRIKFGYVKADSRNACQRMIICGVEMPPYEQVRLTCLETVGYPPPAGCKLTGTLRNIEKLGAPVNCGWVIEGDDGQRVLPLDIPSSFKMEDGKRVYYTYTPVYTADCNCPGGIYGRITCIRQMPNMYQHAN